MAHGMNESWMRWAACAGGSDDLLDLMFASDTAGQKIAKAICQGCPVRPACLSYALENRIMHGVWGGESERSRRRMLGGLRVVA